MKLLASAILCLIFYLVFAVQSRAQSAATGTAPTGAAPKDSQGVIDLGHSLNARLHPVPISAVRLPDGFWGNRQSLIAERTLPGLRQMLESSGAIDNFLRLSQKKNVPRKGRLSSDADLYKWIEASAWAIASPATPPAVKQKLQADIDGLVAVIGAAQDPSGYLDTYFTGERAHQRFTDLVHSHEDYCLSRLLLAGIAYYRTTRQRALLDIGRKFADNVVATFGPSARPFVAAHTDLIGAMVELYRTVDETKYLDFARYLLSAGERDRLHLKDSEIHYLFSGKPFTSRTELEGQAVNALDAAIGATDYFAESGDPAYKHTIDLLWNDLIQRRISIAGGAGLRSNGDTFGETYDVALGSPVAEAPSAISNAQWNLRLLALTGDSRYADVFETALYNSVAASLSQTGGFSCGRGAVPGPGDKAKASYYESESCPPGTPALLMSMGSYFYATGLEGLYISLFGNSELDWRLEDGTPIKVVQATNYPWDGDVKITISPSKPAQFPVHIRWPAWAQTVDVAVNGEKLNDGFEPGTFITITRSWQPGDVITLAMPMTNNTVRANPRADDLWGKQAIERGPLVYSLQPADQSALPVADLFLRSGAAGTAEFHKELLGGMTLLKFPGFAADKPLSSQPLYSFSKDGLVPNRHPVTLVYAPYFALGSRDPDSVETWVPVLRATDTPAPPSTAPRPSAIR